MMTEYLFYTLTYFADDAQKDKIIEELKTQITDYKIYDSIKFVDSESFIYYLSKHKDFLNSFDNVARIFFINTIITGDFSFKLAEYLRENTKIQNIDFGKLHSNITEISSILAPLFVVKDRLKSLEYYESEALDDLTIDKLLEHIARLQTLETLIFTSNIKIINNSILPIIFLILKNNNYKFEHMKHFLQNIYT
jgi:hypothetical protein